MKRIPEEEKAGIYITVIVHLAVLIVMLAAGLDFSLRGENSFVLDFTKYEEKEKMLEEIARLRKEAELQQAIADKLNREIGSASEVRNLAVDRAALKDDRSTDVDKLYKDAERLQKELDKGFSVPDAEIPEEKDEPEKDSGKKQTYRGPSVVSYYLEGRKASSLPIPAYRCLGAGEVTVLITVDNSGSVTGADIDDSCSSTDGCLRAFAIRAARMSRFSISPKSSPKQEGNIVYKFIAQ